MEKDQYFDCFIDSLHEIIDHEDEDSDKHVGRTI